MTTTVRKMNGVTIVDVDGRVALGDGAGALVAQVRELLDDGQRKIVLDLRDVPYMDSAGIGRLVECYMDVRERAGSLRLANSSEKVLELLQITGLHRVFETFAGEGQAA